MEMWSDYYFKDIGDTLGTFILSNDIYDSIPFKLIAHILVELYVIQGLYESMELVMDNKKYTQILHHVNFPFDVINVINKGVSLRTI